MGNEYSVFGRSYEEKGGNVLIPVSDLPELLKNGYKKDKEKIQKLQKQVRELKDLSKAQVNEIGLITRQRDKADSIGVLQRNFAKDLFGKSNYFSQREDTFERLLLDVKAKLDRAEESKEQLQFFRHLIIHRAQIEVNIHPEEEKDERHGDFPIRNSL